MRASSAVTLGRRARIRIGQLREQIAEDEAVALTSSTAQAIGSEKISPTTSESPSAQEQGPRKEPPREETEHAADGGRQAGTEHWSSVDWALTAAGRRW